MLELTANQLKDRGIRVTPQRQAILQYLQETTAHPTAEDIYQRLVQKFPGLSICTVYNTLHLFKDEGLVLELTYGDLSSRFDGNVQNHYHIRCVSCGKVADFHRTLLSDLEKEAAAATNFKVLNHRIEFNGVCPDCQHKLK